MGQTRIHTFLYGEIYCGLLIHMQRTPKGSVDPTLRNPEVVQCQDRKITKFTMSGFRRQQSEEESGWETFAKVAVGVTAAAVGIGAIIGAVNKLSTDTQEQPHSSYTADEPSSEDEDDNTSVIG
ncbi:hypothetical protein MSG28_016123 [Choristoneura fumiferana]|uniref:Uncharacterized protein n=1 Tax=Choristoneura fumiferana TaxID=7141 RepID=A0ACC0K5D3_CHOFU|nr:hypothetical protein MSG28_016123 [Choristoneura fumiferana]